MFEVRLITTNLLPPRVVTIGTPLNDWVDIQGVYEDGVWVFQLDETVWSKPSYFKFLLDGRYWMDDPYIRIAPAAGATYEFDESEVFPMSTMPPTTAAAPAAPSAAEGSVSVPLPAPPELPNMPVTERATINRVVVIATPLITAFVAWLAALIAKHVPGVTFDQTQLVSFMIAIVAVCLAMAWKWLQGWQQHELLVAQKLAAPIKTKPNQ
jgi:hypothetical protein